MYTLSVFNRTAQSRPRWPGLPAWCHATPEERGNWEADRRRAGDSLAGPGRGHQRGEPAGRPEVWRKASAPSSSGWRRKGRVSRLGDLDELTAHEMEQRTVGADEPVRLQMAGGKGWPLPVNIYEIRPAVTEGGLVKPADREPYQACGWCASIMYLELDHPGASRRPNTSPKKVAVLRAADPRDGPSSPERAWVGSPSGTWNVA